MSWDDAAIHAHDTIGAAWLAVAADILARGRPSAYDGMPIVEIAQATLDVARPDPDDAIIARLADPARLEWMRRNFVDPARVAALGDARSYASRLHDYAGTGRDQLDWVVDRLTAEPSSRSATITTFEPLLDTSYIPCVSMLDFWIPDDAVEQLVYAHSIDFGAKGYGGPCPPPGDKPHRYVFTVFALKTEKLDVPANATAAMVGFNLNANKLASATLTALYGR